jgi:hypothetical protein
MASQNAQVLTIVAAIACISIATLVIHFGRQDIEAGLALRKLDKQFDAVMQKLDDADAADQVA